MWQLLIRFGAALAVLVTLLSAAPLVAAQTTTPTVTVAPEHGAPGGTFTFTATFAPHDALGYWFTAPDGTVIGSDDYHIRLGNRGSLSFTWTAPANAQPGEWKITVRPLASATAGQVVTPFWIDGAAQPPASAPTAVTPATGRPGTTFTFRVSGYEPGERAVYWTTAPDGTTKGDESYIIFIDKNGNGEWTWTAPADAPAGTWLMVASGLVSRTTRPISFVIDRDAPPPPTNGPSVTPPSGPAGTTFNFVIEGFAPGEFVNYWLSSPNNQAIGGEDFHTYADGAGRISLSWTAPNDAVGGVWMMVGYGRTSRATNTARFFIG